MVTTSALTSAATRRFALAQAAVAAVPKGVFVDGSPADGHDALAAAEAPAPGVRADAVVLEEEPFGPAAPTVVVDDVEEAIAHANATPLGLATYAYTDDLHAAYRLAAELDTGMVAINSGLRSDVAAPFRGVKWSGGGREGAAAGLDEYLELRAVTYGTRSVPTATVPAAA